MKRICTFYTKEKACKLETYRLCDPGGTRTPNLCGRNAVLYPIKLQNQDFLLACEPLFSIAMQKKRISRT